MKSKLALILTGILLVSTAFSGMAVAQSAPTTTTPDDGADATTTEQSADNTTENASNSTAPETPPGLQLAATIGVAGEQVDSTFERVALGQQFQSADSQEERRDIINSFLEEETEEAGVVTNASDNTSENEPDNETNTSSRDAYEAAMEVASANSAAENAEFAKQIADKYNVSVNDSKVEILRSHASEMNGQEVSTIAKTLGGGPPVFAGPPAHANGNDASENKSDRRGPPAHAGSDNDTDNDTSDVELTTDTVSEKITDAEDAIASAENVSNETLETAESLVADAEQSLTDAQNASSEEARESALETAYETAEEAIETIVDAGDAGETADGETTEDSPEETGTESTERGPPANAGPDNTDTDEDDDDETDTTTTTSE